MPRPEECRFAKTHEWVFLEGDMARIGLSDFAQNELGDIVYVNLGEAERPVVAGDELGEIESVKAVAEVYAPVSGLVVQINPLLGDSPEQLNKDPFGAAWLCTIKLSNPEEVKQLMDHAAYSKFLQEEAH